MAAARLLVMVRNVVTTVAVATAAGVEIGVLVVLMKPRTNACARPRSVTVLVARRDSNVARPDVTGESSTARLSCSVLKQKSAPTRSLASKPALKKRVGRHRR